MDQYGAFLFGVIILLFSVFLFLWMTRHLPSQETFDEFLKDREEKLEIAVGPKKDKKRKTLKKGKVIGVEKKKAEKSYFQQSTSIDADVNGDVAEPQSSRSPSVRPDDVVQKPQSSGKSLDSGTLHQRKTKTKGEPDVTKDGADIQGRPVEKPSGKSVEPKVVNKFVNRSDGSDKRGRMEELDEIYPIEVGNWSYAADTGTSCRSTEQNFATDGKKKSWQDAIFRGENEKEVKLRNVECCQELKSNFELLLKQNLDQKSEIEMLRSTVHAFSVQRLNELQVLREYHDEETKKLVDENRELKEGNRIKQDATLIKNKQLEAMNLTIDDLKQKIDIMGSALETNARMYNASENGRKNAESRLKQFEARIKEMESTARQEIGGVQRSNDVALKLQTKSVAEVEMLRKEIALNADAFQSALAEVDSLRKENATLNSCRRQCDELKKSVELLTSDKEALQKWNDANELQIETSLVECRKTFEQHFSDMEEMLQRKESEVGQLTEDKGTLLFRLSKLEAASVELEAAQLQKTQLEERLKASETETERLKRVEQQLTETVGKLQSEADHQESEKEKAGLSATIRRLQNEMQPNEGAKGDENFRNTNGLIDSLKIADQKELHQELLHQLHLAQSEVKKLEKELKVLRGSTENLTDIDFAYRCVEKSLTNIVDEMEEKVTDLQDRLEVAEADKLETFLQLSQLRATHELVLGELHDLRQTVSPDSYKDDPITENDNGPLSLLA